VRLRVRVRVRVRLRLDQRVRLRVRLDQRVLLEHARGLLRLRLRLLFQEPVEGGQEPWQRRARCPTRP